MANNELGRKFDEFLCSCSEKFAIAQRFRQDSRRYATLEQNQRLFGKIATDYDNSFSNPEFLYNLGFPNADLLSVIHNIFDKSLSSAVLNRPILVWNKSDLLNVLKNYFEDLDIAKLQIELDMLTRATQGKLEDLLMQERSTTNNCFNRVLNSAHADNLDWMAGYGVYISSVEQDMCKFWYKLPKKTVDKIAKHIVDAFFHGFISQSRSIDNRTNIRMVYAIGQEALAQRIVELFGLRGVEPIIMQPSSVAYSDQCLADHSYDTAICIEPEFYENQVSAYSSAIEQYSEHIKNTCGFLRVGTFGNEVKSVAKSVYAYHPNDDVLKMHKKSLSKMRSIEAGVLKPGNLSFCSVVFPDKRIGDSFEEVFESFYKINTEESEPYELIQKSLIDILDGCDKASLIGMNGNETNLTVSLWPLVDKEKETKFLNGGGDINIPHGEIFTTPMLHETNGVLNVKEIYLKNNYYKNLKLTFENGRVVDYGCDNFDSEKKNRRYVFNNLLNGTEKVPMGEFAIGTNTLAYRIAEELSLFSRLPILLAEKMGPHIAIGDPCFARGEDSPVYNIYGGKEVVARENEITKKRKSNPDCYVNFHTDITIPFNEMGLYVGINETTKERHVIIKDGKFVPFDAQRLNENLR